MDLTQNRKTLESVSVVQRINVDVEICDACNIEFLS